MKKLIIIFIALLGISFLFSCEKEVKDPKLDMSLTVAPSITTPANGSSYILVKAGADTTMMECEWTVAQYNLSDLENTKYILQMDLAGNDFADPIDLASTQATSSSTSVGQLNNILLSVMELAPEESHAFELRVRAFINQVSDYSDIYSEVISVSITPYDDQIYIKPIYLLGSGTTIGWDNNAALPMQHIGSGKFARVETVTTGADRFIKFISMLGAWAPQWGTDAAGTTESGILVYRPTESVPDPPAIPFLTAEAGDYYIIADTLNLAYETYLTSGNLFLVGDATPAGWDAGAAIAFTESTPHIFTLTTNLNAGGGMKFLEVQGAWAPQWGTNDKGTNKKGLPVYRPNETVADPPSIPGPAAAGQYTITVDLTTMQYTIEAAK